MSGGNSNITVAFPDHPNWGVWWWNGVENFQLDIVGFLAVLGEGAVLANAQVAALSRLFYLPRILPAPQALIRTSRPTSLTPRTAKVCGVYSGNVKDHVHHVANVLLGEEMSKFDVRCVEVTKTDQGARQPTWADTVFRGQPKRSETNAPSGIPPPSRVRAKATGPLTWVTVIGFLEAVTLLIASIVFGDGMSIIATILLAGLSTIVGICSKWTLHLPQRPPVRHDAVEDGAPANVPKDGIRMDALPPRDVPEDNTPPGDVVIRYPNGSFLVVKCEEHVARELYFAPEEINYEITSDVTYRLLSLLGTLMLMLGIVALANAKLYLQVAWAGAYIIINAAHWIAAALPQSSHWDLSCYAVTEQGLEGGFSNENFTDALWKAIVLTQSIKWVAPGAAAPQTQVWKDWAEDALVQAKGVGKKHWPGKLEKPIWPSDEKPQKFGPEGTIWAVPKWNAKKAWDLLNKPENAGPAANA